MHRARKVNVYLNIYELMSFDKYNGYLVPLGLGAYHSGVEIYGEEFSFGYHDGDHTGIFSIDPRSAMDCRFVYDFPHPHIPLFNWESQETNCFIVFYLSESIFVGETELTYTQVKRITEDMGDDFKGNSYNVFLKYDWDFFGFLITRRAN